MFLKIPLNWHFWNLPHQLELYLDQVNGLTSYSAYKRTVLSFLATFFTILILLTTVSLTPHQRHLLSDPCYFYALPQQLNWIFMLFCLDNVSFHLLMYRPANRTLALVRTILYERHIKKANKFFIQPFIRGRKGGSISTSLELARGYTRKYLFVISYFIVFEVALAAFYRLSSIIKIIQNYTYFFTTISGYLSLLVIFHTAIILDVFVIAYGTVHIIYSIIYICFTIISFLQLGQINGLLKRNNNELLLPSKTLYKFTKHHTVILSFIFDFNVFFGKLLFIFILCQLPVNTYLLTRIVLGQFNLITSVIFLNFIALQFIALVLFHILSAMYCSKIHHCRKLLFHWATTRDNSLRRYSLRALVRIDCYIMKFNTRKKYGITYGSFGLMSFSSFTKFVLFYIECLLYFYQLVRKG